MDSRTRFLSACRCEETDRAPGWLMRQAGRYLPEYQEIRKKHDFLEMVHDPVLAAEITCQPLRRFDGDAAVIFCDILVPCEAMGQGVAFVEGKGPQLSPTIRSAADVDNLVDFDPLKKTGFLWEAIRLTRAELGNEKAIVGFCGAPWTMASYMVEGKGSRSYENTREFMLREPQAFDRLLERVVDNSIRYVGMQLEAGADVIQIFDSWGGALDAQTYRDVIGPHLSRLIQHVKREAPVILYVNGSAHLLETLCAFEPDVLSIDWRIDPEDAIARVGDGIALQGNLDPTILFGPTDTVRREVRRVLDVFRKKRGYLFNLGSGILPKTPVENVAALFEEVRAS